jgi:hypothetical protein
MPNKEKTQPTLEKFEVGSFPEDALLYDRRAGRERRDLPAAADPAKSSNPDRAPKERRARKERRRRIDPTTFEKQYTDDEIEFMNAMQRFKIQSGQAFPTYGEVLRVAHGLGYRKVAEPQESILDHVLAPTDPEV